MAKGTAHDILVDYKRVCSELGRAPPRDEYIKHPSAKYTKRDIAGVFGSWTHFILALGQDVIDPVELPPLRELVLDIETSPMLVWSYGLYDQNHGVNQIEEDSYIYSFAAKWRGNDQIIYMDLRDSPKMRENRPLIQSMRDLLDEADIVLTQNGKRFDVPTIEAQITDYGIRRPSSFKHRDTRIIAKHMRLPSYSLEYMTNRYCKIHKKTKHDKYPGMALFKECRNGNVDAWDENRKYNINDILCTEELADIFAPFDRSVNRDLYHDATHSLCDCGGFFAINLLKPYVYAGTARYQRYTCEKCGAERRGKENLLSTSKKRALRPYSPR